MAIPIYRHNQDHDDWEVASVYDSDDCDSMGRSACDESVHSSGSLNDAALRIQGHLYDGARPLVRYSVPQQQPQNSPLVPSRPRRETRHVPQKQSNFIVPPPGVIFPPKEWTLPPPPPPDRYRPSAPSQMPSPPARPVDAGLAEPPPSSLLLSVSSPPRTPSPLAPPHASSVTLTAAGAGTNVNTRASAMMPSPPRYHDLVHSQTIPARLAEAGCQARPGMGTNPPRRSGYDVPPTSPPSLYAPGLGHAAVEMTVGDGRLGGGGGVSHGPGDRCDLPPVPSDWKYEHEREHGYGYGPGGAGRTKTSSRPQTRERRPSLWRRFMRRFSPHVSVGQT